MDRITCHRRLDEDYIRITVSLIYIRPTVVGLPIDVLVRGPQGRRWTADQA